MSTGIRTFSRYHMARVMEFHYGSGMSLRLIAALTGADHSGLYRALHRAEAGEVFPEVTPRYISFYGCELYVSLSSDGQSAFREKIGTRNGFNAKKPRPVSRHSRFYGQRSSA